jgi:alpha-beta hydrolase superfamily lysophospholipase
LGLSAAALVLLAGAVGTGLPGVLAYLTLHPFTQSTGQTPADYGWAFEEVHFVAADGVTLRGWYLPGRNGATVILVHGFARDRSELLPEASWLLERGYGALLFDLRAHGASGGAHVSLGYLEALDVVAAVDFVSSQSPEERVGLLGYSMGAVAAMRAVAVNQLTRAAVNGLVLVSPFADPRQTLDRRLRGLRFLAPGVIWWGEHLSGIRLDDLRPLDDVADLTPCPILIMQAGADAVVPLDSGERLYQAASQPKELWSVPGVGHVDFRQALPQAYRERLLVFFERYLLEDK